jgi:hypothetical protein
MKLSHLLGKQARVVVGRTAKGWQVNIGVLLIAGVVRLIQNDDAHVRQRANSALLAHHHLHASLFGASPHVIAFCFVHPTVQSGNSTRETPRHSLSRLGSERDFWHQQVGGAPLLQDAHNRVPSRFPSYRSLSRHATRRSHVDTG